MCYELPLAEGFVCVRYVNLVADGLVCKRCELLFAEDNVCVRCELNLLAGCLVCKCCELLLAVGHRGDKLRAPHFLVATCIGNGIDISCPPHCGVAQELSWPLPVGCVGSPVAVISVQLPITAAVLSFMLQGELLFYTLFFAAVLGKQLPIISIRCPPQVGVVHAIAK